MPSPTARYLPRHQRESRRWVLPLVVVLVWLFVGGPLGSFAGRLSEVQKNDNASFLPKATESTEVLDRLQRFTGPQPLPTTVVFERSGGLRTSDRTRIRAYVRQLAEVRHVDPATVGPATYSTDGEAAQVVVPIRSSDGEQIQAPSRHPRGRARTARRGSPRWSAARAASSATSSRRSAPSTGSCWWSPSSWCW